MNGINAINTGNGTNINQVNHQARNEVTAPGASSRNQPSEVREVDRDEVQLSESAQRVSGSSDLSIRSGLIEQVRAQIESGEYETEDRINEALENLARDIL